jgi:RHS repeat-associated protein
MRWGAALAAAVFAGTLPGSATAQSCTAESRLHTVNAAFAQFAEIGGRDEWVADWVRLLGEGYTVKTMMSANLHDPGYFARFVDGRSSSSAILTDLYRHILAREPDDGAWGMIGVGETHGWHAVIDAMLNSAEYNARFGDHIVPGDPIVAWDCARANFTAQAHQGTSRDATQGAAAVSYTTPAYVSLDQPRSLTFAYSSGVARPTGLVRINVVHNTNDAPSRASIRLQLNGGWLTDEVFFNAGAGATQLSAQFDAGAHYSAAWTITAVVRKYWADGRMQETPVPVRVPIVNERNSPFGAGWMLAGYQRLKDQGDGVFITEGGVGSWFERLGACGADGICRYTSPAGDFSTMTYNGYTFDRRYPDGSVVRFAHDGRMLDHRDRFSNLTVYGYDGSGRLTSVTDPIGKVITLGYTGAGALAWVEDPMGRRTTTAAYNSALYHFRHPDNTLALDLHLVQDGTGAWVLDTYWTEAAPRATGWHMGTHFDYDAHGQVAAVTAPQVKVTDVGVGQNVDMRPVVTSRSLEMAVLAPSGTGSVGNPAPRVLPENVRVEGTDARGFTTRAAVDPFGAPTRIEEPLGRVTSLTRDRHGRSMRTVASSGHVSRAEYRGMELRLTEDLVTGVVVEMTYTRDHQLLAATGGSTSVASTYERDENDPAGSGGSLIKSQVGSEIRAFISGVDGRTTRIFGPGRDMKIFHENQYPAFGNTQFVVSTGNVWTEYTYDGGGRPNKVRRARGYPTPRGDSVLHEYDSLNRLRSTTDPAGHVTRYDHAPLFKRITDPRGESHEFTFNALGWLVTRRDPGGRVESYRYDRNGNLTSSTNRRGQKITYAYDELNRLRWRDADGERTVFDPDANGLVSVIANAESLDSVVTDLSRTASVRVARRAGSRFALSSSYDPGGKLISVQSVAPWSGYGVVYHYLPDGSDGLGGLCTTSPVSSCVGPTTTLGYDPAQRASVISLPVGTVTASGASVRYSLATVDSALGVTLSRDVDGRVEKRTTVAEDSTRNFKYDRRGQLTRVDDYVRRDVEECGYDPTRTPQQYCYPVQLWDLSRQQSYSYDAVGNRNDSGAVLEVGNRLTSFDGFSLIYDDDGNLTRKVKPGVDDLQIGWNSFGQLTGASRFQVGSLRYGYDASGMRVRKTYPDGRVVRYLYSRENLVAEVDGSGAVLTEYHYLPGLDRPHSLRRGGQIYYYLTDGPGNVVGLVDASGNLVNEYRYGPWGAAEYVRETVPQPLRFTGREYDGELGLYYYRARWYDPHAGRFISEDPLGISAGPDPYAYVGNDPVNRNDPSGLCPGWSGSNVGYIPLTGGALYNICTRDTLFRTISDVFARARDCRLSFYCSDPAAEARHMEALDNELRQNEPGAHARATEAVNSTPYQRGQNDAFGPSDQIVLGVGARLAPVKPYLDAAALAVISLPLTAEGYGTMAVLGLSRGFATAAQTGDHIVLGLRAYGLVDVAKSVGGRHLLHDANWMQTLRTGVATPSTRFTVSLNGFAGSTPYSQVMGAVQKGLTPFAAPTQWEMAPLHQAGRLETSTFMLYGQIVFPF